MIATAPHAELAELRLRADGHEHGHRTNVAHIDRHDQQLRRVHRLAIAGLVIDFIIIATGLAAWLLRGLQ